MSIATEYAAYCTSIAYDNLPTDVVDHTKNLLQDHIAVAVGGQYSPSASTFIESLQEVNGGADGAATVLATGESMLPTHAAMLNGTLAHSLDYDDIGGPGHPGACVIPAALAAAERTGASGRKLVEGIVAGYEIMDRLGDAINQEKHYNRGFHPTATCGHFGATAAASVVLGLPREEIEDAFGVNVSQVSGNHGYIRHGGSNKRIHPGLAAKSALVATTLAKNGFNGTNQPFEGHQNFFYAFTEDARPERATTALGEEHRILETGFKLYPSCGRNHTAIAATLELMDTHNIDPESVESIDVEAWEMAVENMARPRDVKTNPSDIFDAQFSLPFSIAFVLARSEFRLDTLLSEMQGGYDDDIQRLMDRMTVENTPGIEAEVGGKQKPVSITVTTTSERYTNSAVYRRGDPQNNPPTQKELDEKFRELTTRLSTEQQNAVLDRVSAIEARSARELTEPFRS